MTTDEFIQPREWDTAALRRDIEEWQANTAALLEGLEKPRPAEGENWWPHREQMRRAVEQFVLLCEAELESFGSWDDEFSPDEVHEFIWDEGTQLVDWLQRMIGS